MTPRVADDGAALATWLRQAGITDIRVVSPHLDDAAFSLAEFLARPGFPPRRVLTVFTEAGPSTGQDYARAMGFADAAEEFRSRRYEDSAAMRRLGVGFTHCGLESGTLHAADAMERYVLQGAAPERTLVLLPLGAGRVLSGVRRLGRRILRRPSGCGVHGEHVWVHDQLQSATRLAKLRLGFYAEVPYQWANAPTELATLARKLANAPVSTFVLRPDPDAKMAVVQDYASQFEAEFGQRPDFQKRGISIAERIYLPAETGPRRTATDDGGTAEIVTADSNKR